MKDPNWKWCDMPDHATEKIPPQKLKTWTFQGTNETFYICSMCVNFLIIDWIEANKDKLKKRQKECVLQAGK